MKKHLLKFTFSRLIIGIVTSWLIGYAISTANMACTIFWYQPKVPKSLLKK